MSGEERYEVKVVDDFDGAAYDTVDGSLVGSSSPEHLTLQGRTHRFVAYVVYEDPEGDDVGPYTWSEELDIDIADSVPAGSRKALAGRVAEAAAKAGLMEGWETIKISDEMIGLYW